MAQDWSESVVRPASRQGRLWVNNGPDMNASQIVPG